MRNLRYVLPVLFLGSCAYKAQVVHLTPNISAPTSMASGPEVVLRARDARANPQIGMRAAGSRDEAPISTDQDLAGLLREKTGHILHGWGYRADPTVVSGPRSLEIELTELSYNTVTEAGERRVKIRAVLKASAQNGRAGLNKSFEAAEERRILVEPVAKSNEEWINETFTRALTELATDQRLRDFLK